MSETRYAERYNGINATGKQYNRTSDRTIGTSLIGSAAEYVGNLEAQRRRRIAREKANAPIIVKKRVKAEAFPVGFIFYAAIVTLVLMFVVYSYSVVNDTTYEIGELETKLSEAKEENERLSLKLEERNNLADIEQYATETLGMVKSTDVIKHYVNVNGGDEIEINENVGESTYLGAVLDSLKTSVGKIYE